MNATGHEFEHPRGTGAGSALAILAQVVAAIAGYVAIILFAIPAGAQDDPGRSELSRLQVSVIFATNGDVSRAGDHATELDTATRRRLTAEPELRFEDYRLLGTETQAIFRSYENWSQPLKPSDAVLLRFAARSRPTTEKADLDLDFWFNRKMIMKTDVVFEDGRVIYILGPEWRGGRLIIALGLASDSDPND